MLVKGARPRSQFFSQAAALLATHLINSGRYSRAEDVLLRAISTVPVAKSHELERDAQSALSLRGAV